VFLFWETIMRDATLVGIDLGKHSFHLHGQDLHGKAVFRKKMGRKQLVEFFATFHVCTVVMEACAGAHHMARQLAGFGHQVKLISPQFVRPFVKSNKNDFVDAEAICEAASRPAMRFVTPKTEAQQTLSALHRVRESLVRDRTKSVNQIHGFLLEFGISLPVGQAVIKRLPAVLAEHTLPPRLITILERLREHFKYLSEQIVEIDREMARELAKDDLGQRLLTIPGVGPITASVLTAEMGDGKQYGCSRDFAASLGLVSTAPEVELTFWASANEVTRIYGASSCSAPVPTCSGLITIAGGWPSGCAPCSRVDIPTSWPARWRTSLRARHGRCPRATHSSTRA
jgi:transposase